MAIHETAPSAAVSSIDGKMSSTSFGELRAAQRVSQLNLKPTWGASVLRYTIATSGTGAAAAETGGEFRLQSGTATSNTASIRTKARGQYHAGSMGQAGIGVRLPTAPASTAFAEWGYTDFTNGLYFGVDATGVYVAYVTGGSATKVYQSNWNIDVLDGTGASGLTLDLAKGVISQIEFTWYGYGTIEFSFMLVDPLTRETARYACHRIRVEESVSVIDPNQPLAFRVGNGASSTTDLSLYIGGHQFSTFEGDSTPQTRRFAELLTSYTLALNTNWQPLIAFRKKANFNGRADSVAVRLETFQVASDSDLEIRTTIGGTTNNLTWGTPTGHTATETAVESKVTGGTALTTSADGTPGEYAFVSAAGSGGNRGGEKEAEAEFDLGEDLEVILWVRRLSATGAMIVKHASLIWREMW